jgi:YebC/PmpR family DNA-binding regulatory protein
MSRPLVRTAASTMVLPNASNTAYICRSCKRLSPTTLLVPLLSTASSFAHLPYTSSAVPISRNDHRPRHLSSTAHLASGHNRWSKIKHDKAKKDASQTKARSQLARDLAQASKAGGPDPSSNPKLPALLLTARKIGFSKASCEAAIARGQGQSTSGASLVGFEWGLMHPATGGVVLVECLTDNKARAMQVLREAVKGTQEASVEWMFERRGRITLLHPVLQGEPVNNDTGDEAVMEAALEAGALDVEFEDEGVDVITEPNEMTSVQDAIENALGRKAERTELVWRAKDDVIVELDEEAQEGQSFGRLIDKLEDADGVVAVWTNVR